MYHEFIILCHYRLLAIVRSGTSEQTVDAKDLPLYGFAFIGNNAKLASIPKDSVYVDLELKEDDCKETDSLNWRDLRNLRVLKIKCEDDERAVPIDTLERILDAIPSNVVLILNQTPRFRQARMTTVFIEEAGERQCANGHHCFRRFIDLGIEF